MSYSALTTFPRNTFPPLLLSPKNNNRQISSTIFPNDKEQSTICHILSTTANVELAYRINRPAIVYAKGKLGNCYRIKRHNATTIRRVFGTRILASSLLHGFSAFDERPESPVITVAFRIRVGLVGARAASAPEVDGPAEKLQANCA